MNKVRGAASLAAGAALGITIAQAALPAIADTLHPTARGTILVTIFGALLSASLERGRDLLSRRRTLKGALPDWPPPLLEDADLAQLGVYPPREPDGSIPDYVMRAPDDQLRAALRTIRDQLKASGNARGRRANASWHVIVRGPPGAGKSRAAAEAARTVLPDVPAIIPVDSDALGGLADTSVTLDVPGVDVCLWLDGLDRFLDALDIRGLHTLDEVKERVVIVATIRTEQWDDLINGTGQSTDVLRALAARATVVPFGAHEAADQQHAGGADLAPAADAASGAPAAPAVPGDGRPRSRRRWERPALADPALGLAILAMAAIVAVVLIWRSHFVDPPPLSSQMNTIRTQMTAADGPASGRVVVDEQVQLHHTDAPSWVIVVEQYPTHAAWVAKVEAAGPKSHVLSDELRIYDVVGGRLRLELDYRPRGHGRNAADWQPLIGADPVDDFANDGENQLIAAYGQPDHGYEALIPFGVQWVRDRYQLVTLTAASTEIPNLSYTGPSAALRSIYSTLYATSGPMSNAVAAPRFHTDMLYGYRVGVFAYDPGDATRPPRLLTGYLAAYESAKRPLVLSVYASQILTGSLTLGPCTANNYYCPAPRTPVQVRVPPSVSTDHALLLAWSTIDTRWDTPVQVVGAAARRVSAKPTAPRRSQTPARRRSAAARSRRRG